MGCSVSAIENALVAKNGKINSIKDKCDTLRAPMDNGNAKFDPRFPLTVRQKFSIIKSWKGISRNIEETGILMFLRMFETNEEIRTMFAKIVSHDVYDASQIRESKGLENHVKQVMYTLDEAISSIEDVDDTINLLQSVGRSHRRLKTSGFDPSIFWKIEEPFLTAVKETLGDRYTANMEHIYGKTIKFILETLIRGFNED
ncbi:neuroglobin-like [Dreissena polymorpha]|uniref:Globin domain-containing protein n=1 Tax=Dreissena polymorpha TaxID=45954 RepID=A0A9D4KW06_DREPO|nr:neuroglobin-like [Dreissena polymorpha]KAH3846041.1 hypothetical protein DPMN_088335 [Dreissena polymorpha]